MIKKLEPKHLGISNRLLEFLAPEEDKRLTKLEAYRDLLEMATHFKSHVSCYGQEFDLMPGEIVTSISELAKKWRWQRATVRKFVDTLVELEQVIHTPQVKCSRMELISLRFKWLPTDHPMNLLSANGFANDDMPLAESGQLITSIILMAPGIVFFSAHNILANYFQGTGMPKYNLYASIIGLAITLPSVYILIPRLGIAGAAISTSITFAAIFVYQWIVFHRMTGIRLCQLVPNSDDWNWVKEETTRIFKKD